MVDKSTVKNKLSSVYKALFRTKTLTTEEIQFSQLKRCLSVVDLSCLGIGSTLGAGVYVITGQVARDVTGPSVVLSFLIAGVASFLSGICYSEFAARVPRAGSAYTYSYITIGELWAFVIGWNMILENMIGAASVAKAWSQYLDALTNQTIQRSIMENVGTINVHGLAEFPDFVAFALLTVATLLICLGVKFSTRLSSVFTILNLLVIVSIVVLGLLQADGRNWTDYPGFFPMGYEGVIAGAATCFYAFIGFDTVATAGEEAQNPSKSIPTAIMATLVICFMVYFGVSTALTLMISWKDLPAQATLPMAFAKKGVYGAEYVITIGGMCGLTAAMMNSLFPLPRNVYALAHDGLIFKALGHINSWTNTPILATWIVGISSALLAMFMDLQSLVQLMSIGTLMAYTLVSICTLLLHYQRDHVGLSVFESVDVLPELQSTQTSEADTVKEKRQLGEGTSLLNLTGSKSSSPRYSSDKQTTVYKRVSNLRGTVDIEDETGSEISRDDESIVEAPVKQQSEENVNNKSESTKGSGPVGSTYQRVSSNYSLSNFSQLFNSDETANQKEPTEHSRKTAVCSILSSLSVWIIFCVFTTFGYGLPVWFVILVIIILLTLVIICMAVLVKQPRNQIKLHFKVPFVPFIPMASAMINLYLMVTLAPVTWVRFAIWIAIGFIIYFTYGIWHSVERRSADQEVILYNMADTESFTSGLSSSVQNKHPQIINNMTN